ncbi:N-acetylmuramoyl-L-alanine amidase [Thalassorhabdus alkalitolerans]|uniref:N-acetylmuramoyl-L-alanine amidase n=1 Tax=Thalassorhabdus alkalitolerans TaxID=2282697 RepID=A0ABW0YL68_9BACI
MSVRVFIDPGHGGSDTGAVGNGLVEKDLALDTALHIRDILQNEYSGAEINMSRTTDVDVSLENRVQQANSWGADIFISVHYNAAASGVSGFETYRYQGAPQRTEELHEVIHRELYNFAWSGRMPDRGSMTAGFYVIRHTTMPSILTEGGFVTNSNDASYLQDPSFIEQAARAHAAALAAAFDDITENGGNGGGDEDTPDTPDEENWSGQILQEGFRGPLVRDLQQRLLDLGYDLGTYGADGIYGPVTREAVRSFQQDAGITVDGIAGPKTYRAMEEVSGGWSGQILQEGSRGPLVRDLQQRLLDLGYDLGSYGADGIYGPVTREAVRSFQQDAGITVDGIAGPATHRALEEAERQG